MTAKQAPMTSKEAWSNLLRYEITSAPIFLTDDAEQAWMAADPGFRALEDVWNTFPETDEPDSDPALMQQLDDERCPFLADAQRERGVTDLVYHLAGKDAAMQVAFYLAKHPTGLDRLAAILGRDTIARQGQ